MKLGIIDLDMLQKEIDQHETLGANASGEDRDQYFSVSHALQRAMSKTSELTPLITRVWNIAQQATADREGYINVNMDPEAVKLKDLINVIVNGEKT